MLILRNNLDTEASTFLFRSNNPFLKELAIFKVGRLNTERDCLQTFKNIFRTPTLANMCSIFSGRVEFSTFIKLSKKFGRINNIDGMYLIRYILKKVFIVVLKCNLPDCRRITNKLHPKKLWDTFDTCFINNLRNSLEFITYFFTFFEAELRTVFSLDDMKIIETKITELKNIFKLINKDIAKIYERISIKSKDIKVFRNLGFDFPFDNYTFSQKIKRPLKLRDVELTKRPVLTNYSYDPGRSIIATVGIKEMMLTFNNDLHYQPDRVVSTGKVNKYIFDQWSFNRHALFNDSDILDILTYTATRKDKVRVFISQSY